MDEKEILKNIIDKPTAQISASIRGLSNMNLETKKALESFSRLGTLGSATAQISASIHGLSNMTLQSLVNNDILFRAPSAIREVLNNIDYRHVNINEDGVISYGNEIINVNETIEEINGFIDEDISLYKKVEKFKEKHFIIYLLLMLLISTFIIEPTYSLGSEFVREKINHITAQYITKSSIKQEGDVNKSIKKEVVSEINDSIDDEGIKRYIYNGYRFVSIEILNVRASDTIKSRIVYRLRCGQVVKIIKKNKNWTYIEYESDDGSIKVKGWVYTRYISKFN